MLPNLAPYISIVFILTILLTLILFYFVLKASSIKASAIKYILAGLAFWLILQMTLSWNHFYSENTLTMPPRFLLLVAPPLVLIISLFLTKKGRAFMDGLALTQLTYLNIVRIAVEIVLYWLFLSKAIPELMTFAGRNFDILAGISAPFVAYWGIQKHKMGNRFLLIWNIIALGLLLNIVIHAVLSIPTAFQQLAFEQPNIGVLYFPFSCLPGFIVPIVLFGHLVSIRQLLKAKKSD